MPWPSLTTKADPHRPLRVRSVLIIDSYWRHQNPVLYCIYRTYLPHLWIAVVVIWTRERPSLAFELLHSRRVNSIVRLFKVVTRHIILILSCIRLMPSHHHAGIVMLPYLSKTLDNNLPWGRHWGDCFRKAIPEPIRNWPSDIYSQANPTVCSMIRPLSHTEDWSKTRTNETDHYRHSKLISRSH